MNEIKNCRIETLFCNGVEKSKEKEINQNIKQKKISLVILREKRVKSKESVRNI